MRRMTVLAPLTVLAVLATAGCQAVEEDTAPDGTAHPVEDRSARSTAPPVREPAPPTHEAPASRSPASPAPDVVAPEGPVAREAWHTEEVQPVTAPALIGGVLVLYSVTGKDGKDLSINGIDPADGALLWSHPATPSQSVGGVSLTLHEVDGAVVHLAPVEGDFRGEAPAVVVLRDPVTGEELRATEDPLSHGSLPGPCEHDPDRVCARIRVDGVWTELGLADDGTFRQVPESAATGWSPIAPLGLSRSGREGTSLARVVGGEVLWQADTEELFAEGSSTNSGWNFQAFADDTLLVGSVGTRTSAPSYRTVWDLPAYRTVGIDAATGERRWLAEHTSSFCDVDVTGEDEDPLLACLWHSGERVTVQRESTFSDLDVDLVRLDPVTGEPLWTVPLDEPVWAEGQVPPVLRPVDGQHLSVDTTAGPVVVDVDSGATRPGGPGDVAWVEEDPYHGVTVPGSGEPTSTVTGTGRFVPRDAAGQRAEQVPWPLPPTVAVTVEDSGVRVVADRSGLTGYGPP